MDADPSGESLLSLMTWTLWGLVAFCALFYFVYCYLVEILAQKLDEPRWMAWVPLVNALLMLRLVGWEKWFWVMLGGYAVALGGMFLPPPLVFVGAIAILPVAIAAIVIGFAYFPRLALRRGLPLSVGLWVVLPQFAPPVVEWLAPGIGVWMALLATAAALVAFLWIVFHDGRPLHGPHPVGYALTLLGVLVTGALLQRLPAELAGDEELQKTWQQIGAQLESTPVANLRHWADASQEAASEIAPAAWLPGEPDPVRIADTCPPGTRERRGHRGRGRAWWCEIEGEKSGVRHGPSRSWFDNGFLETEGAYDRGRRTGTWTRYWRHGGRRVQAEFRDDVQHGWMHRWNADGNAEAAVRYEDGEPAAL